MAKFTKQLLQRDGQCMGGVAGSPGEETGITFAGKDWILTVRFPQNLNQAVMHKIRDHTGDLVRVCVMLKDE